MSDDIVTWLRKASSTIYMACEKDVADDISPKLTDASNAIVLLTEEVANLRAALRDSYVASAGPDDALSSYCSACHSSWDGPIEHHEGECWLIELIGPRAALPEETP